MNADDLRQLSEIVSTAADAGGNLATVAALRNLERALDQAAVDLEAPAPCLRCEGTGESWFVAASMRARSRGKWVTCPDCKGTGHAP